jgi:hypothetical protein
MTRIRSFIPTIDRLECRLTPATLVDLTTHDAEGELGEALVVQTGYGPTGTGVMNTFVRLQAKKKDNGIEQGYNTDARPLEFDEKKGRHTRSIQLGDVPQIEIDGMVYREFLLDINEPGGGRRELSLDELRLYAGDAPDLTGYDEGTQELDGLTAFFDMDADEDLYVLLNAKLSHGSGSGDMFLRIPESTFVAAGVTADSYLYLWSRFGDNAKAQGGFEEWGYRNLPPLAATSSLSGFVYFDADGSGTRDDGEAGIVGVTLVLTNAAGDVIGSTVTGDDGSYAFTVVAGTYTITEVQPAGFADGGDSVGTVDGVERGTNLGGDTLADILLGANEHGIDYNFGEVSLGG